MYQDATQTFAGERKANKPNPIAGNLKKETSAWASMGKPLDVKYISHKRPDT